MGGGGTELGKRESQGCLDLYEQLHVIVQLPYFICNFLHIQQFFAFLNTDCSATERNFTETEVHVDGPSFT